MKIMSISQTSLFTKNPSPTDEFTPAKMPRLSTFGNNMRPPKLSVSTDMLVDAGNVEYPSGGSSPPPPALSPASSSPNHASNALMNPESPSPPIIVAEIVGQSAILTGGLHMKTSNSLKPRSPAVSTHTPNLSNICLSGKTVDLPRVSDPLTSSSSTSSSSSSSSSLTPSPVGRVPNGLPILEKISRVLSSPRRSLGDSNNTLIPSVNSKPSEQASPILSGVPSPPFHLSSCRVTVQPLQSTIDLKVDDHAPPAEVAPVTIPRPKKKYNTSNRRRAKPTKRSRASPDSDFEVQDTRSARGKGNVTAVIQRVKQQNAKKRYAIIFDKR